MTDKKQKFLEKLIFIVETEFGSPDEMMNYLIEEHKISRKEITDIYEQEKLNKNTKLTDEAIKCLKKWSSNKIFWN